ncbi:PREDICTED: uncharacterized protein LOC105564030 [Vollenhovia emeryi]|uniref:uncharacterized protein LOC105564030 n=1 Tax=Vollenhovia emeryi TaxID=411798 RepID=UPI0005F3934E|nr:PREDICTED: uncharacterized protein LOC105564030 [Vollenhovia emeryi]XP_011871500.1 PREDICTED: uncharacterized protein LOC105564030 [Vollenhovia emeryi]
MNEREDIAISIIRMERLLAIVTNKIEKSIEKLGVHASPLLREIIDLVGLLKKFVTSRMKRTPEAERTHAINLHDCRAKVAEAMAELEALREMSEEQDSNSEIFLRDIVTCVNDEEKVIRSIRETSEIKIPAEIEQSMREMLIVREREEARKVVLRSEIDSAERRLHDVVESNATSEKMLFDACAQVEREYITLLAKYDCDIGAFHKLAEELSRENEAVKGEIKEMEEKLIVQRELYASFKKEQELALMKAFAEKLELFRRNRAAKVIQRAWRAYLERISLKKRRKAKKK